MKERIRAVAPNHRKKLILSVAIAAAIAVALPLAGPTQAKVQAEFEGTSAALVVNASTPRSFADLVERVLPAVVNISTSGRTIPAELRTLPELDMPRDSRFERFLREHFGDRFPSPGMPGPTPPPETRSVGSGFIIDADGIIVTNHHVIENAREIKVTLHDGRQLAATVVGRDQKTDLALLRVEPDEPLDFVEFGDSDATRVGDWVVAVGNPFGLGSTVTAGIVSARGRDIRSGPFDDFLQVDAPINRGNSGGPLFNRNGKVIGVNAAIFSPTGGNVGIGFAIPARLAKPVVADLRGQGHVDRGWMGVQIQAVDRELADALGLDSPRGALVAGVLPDSPASEADIRPGDVVLKFDGEAVEEIRDLPKLVAGAKAEQEVNIELWRDRAERTVKLTVGQSLAGNANAKLEETPLDTEKLGLQLAALTPEIRRRFDVGPDSDGVLVAGVAPGSQAAARGIRPGDLIVAVEREAVSTPLDVVEKVRTARKASRGSVLLLVHRNQRAYFVAVPVTPA